MSVSFSLSIELGNSPMQNTSHLHRQASYQSQFPCLSICFGGVKTTNRLITCPPDIKITKLLSLREGHICLVTVSAYTQLARLTYWDDHTGANSLALRWQISRVILCSSVVITHRATQGRPLLPGTPLEQDDRSFILGWTLIHWTAICIC